MLWIHVHTFMWGRRTILVATLQVTFTLKSVCMWLCVCTENMCHITYVGRHHPPFLKQNLCVVYVLLSEPSASWDSSVSGNLNSTPRACMANSLSTETSPQAFYHLTPYPLTSLSHSSQQPLLYSQDPPPSSEVPGSLAHTTSPSCNQLPQSLALSLFLFRTSVQMSLS